MIQHLIMAEALESCGRAPAIAAVAWRPTFEAERRDQG